MARTGAPRPLRPLPPPLESGCMVVVPAPPTPAPALERDRRLDDDDPASKDRLLLLLLRPPPLRSLLPLLPRCCLPPAPVEDEDEEEEGADIPSFSITQVEFISTVLTAPDRPPCPLRPR